MCYNEFMTKTCQIIALFFFAIVFSSKANAIELRFPVACKLMDNCWITNHVDLNRRTGEREDYMCGKKLTDNNKSTHISLKSRSSVESNIPVIAAANGTVKIAQNIGGFCGVRVLIEHEKGWESNYCHLNPSTLQVKKGQIVKPGQIIGSIGMSGKTQWPHLSYALLRNDMVFDPFSGKTPLEGCSGYSNPLWGGGINPIYEPAQVTSIGFNFGTISSKTIMDGAAKSATAMKSQTPQISLWVMMMNIQKGDEITLKVIEPSGRILNEQIIKVDFDQKYYPVHLSTLRKNFLWDKGNYKGVVTISRYVEGNKITTGKYTGVNLQ